MPRMSKTLSVRSKLVLSSFLATGLIVVVGTAGWFGTQSLRGSMSDIVESSKRLRSELEADQLHDALRGDVFAALFDANKQSRGREKAIQRAQEHVAGLRDRITLVRENAPHHVVEALDAASPNIDLYTKLALEEVALAYDDHPAAAEKSHEFMDAYRKVEAQMAKVEEAILRHNDRAQERGIASSALAMQVMVAVCIAAAFLLIGIKLAMSRSILKRLKQGSDAATRVAAGDLSKTIDIGSDDEIGRLLR